MNLINCFKKFYYKLHCFTLIKILYEKVPDLIRTQLSVCPNDNSIFIVTMLLKNRHKYKYSIIIDYTFA